MVWKNNFLVEGIPKTLEGLLDEISSFEVLRYTILFFHFPLCYFKQPKDVLRLRFYLDEKHFPQHFIFGNFQCLRCGLCCKNYEYIPIEGKQIKHWKSEGREDVLQYVHTEVFPTGFFAEIYPRRMTGCPLCRKVRGKPYYYCRIQSAKRYLPFCKAYLCSKSLPIAHLNYRDVDELVEIIGVGGYYGLIERVWGEQFDYLICEFKTH